MKVRTLFLLLTVAAIAVFTALNWSAFMAPATLSLGVANVQAPLGLVMLGLVAFLAALFLVFVVYLQTSVLLEARRHARELQANRELADQAEASRFTELRGFLEAELTRQAGLDAESRVVVLARLDQLDRDLRSAVEQSGNTLAAYIGELEDRLERGRAT
ncbi:MAG: Signal transduction histidine kinase [Deltaproteobacteria bacterium HGW-Deltaproteobacteria-16]|nr:MAG: Signal transduction histidine kinase [Deltaproteobacteria bacterium HGW-Deltaproteobacteria-16]